MMDHTRTHKMANRMNADPGLIKMIDSLMKCNVATRMAKDNGLFELRNPEINGMHAKGLISRPISLIRRH